LKMSSVLAFCNTILI